jgi:hypothetical protein
MNCIYQISYSHLTDIRERIEIPLKESRAVFRPMDIPRGPQCSPNLAGYIGIWVNHLSLLQVLTMRSMFSRLTPDIFVSKICRKMQIPLQL